MLEAIETWIAIASSVGIVALIGFLFRYAWQRWRWNRFTSLVDQWAETEPTAASEKGELAKTLDPLVSNWLIDAGFTPQESLKLFEFAARFAQGRVDLFNKEWEKRQ